MFALGQDEDGMIYQTLVNLSTACQCISRLCHWLVFFRVFLWYVLDDWTCTVCTGLSLWALDAECSSTKGSNGRPQRTVKQQLKWVDGHEEHEEEPQIWQTTLYTQLAVLDKLCHRLHSGFKAFGLASSQYLTVSHSSHISHENAWDMFNVRWLICLSLSAACLCRSLVGPECSLCNWTSVHYSNYIVVP